jgi:hypothetical protein
MHNMLVLEVSFLWHGNVFFPRGVSFSVCVSLVECYKYLFSINTYKYILYIVELKNTFHSEKAKIF